VRFSARTKKNSAFRTFENMFEAPSTTQAQQKCSHFYKIAHIVYNFAHIWTILLIFRQNCSYFVQNCSYLYKIAHISTRTYLNLISCICIKMIDSRSATSTHAHRPVYVQFLRKKNPQREKYTHNGASARLILLKIIFNNKIQQNFFL